LWKCLQQHSNNYYSKGKDNNSARRRETAKKKERIKNAWDGRKWKVEKNEIRRRKSKGKEAERSKGGGK
jgi:hypothetical protein